MFQVATTLLVAGPCGYPGRHYLHPLARTPALFKGYLYNVRGRLWLIPINAQYLTGHSSSQDTLGPGYTTPFSR